jgi:hypothetical protein
MRMHAQIDRMGEDGRWKPVGSPLIDPEPLPKREFPPRGGWVFDVPADLVELGLKAGCKVTLAAGKPWYVKSVKAADGDPDTVEVVVTGDAPERPQQAHGRAKRAASRVTTRKAPEKPQEQATEPAE